MKRLWKKVRLVTTVVILESALLVGPAQAGELGLRMEKAVKRLMQSSETRGFSGATAAVMPFQTDEKLAKKRVDFAVSELLTQMLFKTGKLMLIERNRLDAVLREQKLGLTGAIDSETAARVGKIAGARLLVLGSVSQLGSTYQINVRLVDSETAEIVSPEIFEVPVKIFDEEAARYLTLVPERQAIGLQFLPLGRLPFTGSASDKRTFTATYGTVNAEPSVNGSMNYWNTYTLGVKYFPLSWLVLEGAYCLPINWKSTKAMTNIKPTSSNIYADTRERNIDLSIDTIMYGVSYTQKFFKHFRAYAGMQHWLVNVNTDFQDIIVNLGQGNNIVFTASPDKNLNFGILMARLGIEWRPQARIGVAFFGNANLTPSEKVYKVRVYEVLGQNYPWTETMDVFTLKLRSFTLDIALAFYF